MSDTDIEMVSTAERVYGLLRDEIVSGKRPAGARISEQRVAAELGISRQPVRRAIRSLVRDGLIDRSPRRGGIVHRLTRTDIADISEVYAACDQLAVRHAALRRSDGDLQRFREDVGRARDAVAARDAAALRAAGLAFRVHVYEATHNPVLLEVHAALLGRTLQLLELSDPAVTAPLEYYERFERAFERRDPEAASAAMAALARHLADARRARVLAELAEDDVVVSMNHGGDQPSEIIDDDAYVPDHVRVHRGLQQQILSGARGPGDALSERYLAEEFGVSRIPVAEAIDLLVMEGLAETGTSTRVPARVRGLRPEELADLFDLGVSLDILAARLAAQRRTGAELLELGRRLRAEEKAASGPTALLLEGMFAFRRQVYTMAANGVLCEVNALLESRLRLLVSRTPLASLVVRGHRALYEAIANRDVILAEGVFHGMFAREDRRNEILTNVPRRALHSRARR